MPSPAALLVLLGAVSSAAAQVHPTVLAGVDSSGLQGNGDSWDPAITPDGRFIVFETQATNLVVPDAGDFFDIVLKDMRTGAIERISINTSGEQGNGDSFDPSISADGRYVAFDSKATNLVPNDLNGQDDVFVRDRLNGTTTRISVTAAGTEGIRNSSAAAITPDGRYVAFMSQSDLLLLGHLDQYNIFVRDLQTGTITLESLSLHGSEWKQGGIQPSITPDARYVVFSSMSWHVQPGDTNFSFDVFVRDRVLGTFERVSVDSSGMDHKGDSQAPAAISDDGRYVAYTTRAELDASDDNEERDVYVRDRQLGLTLLITPCSKGGVTFGLPSDLPLISADGRWVVFPSYSFVLVPGDTNNYRDLFMHDLLSGDTQRINYGFAGDQTNEISGWPAMTPDARLVAFASNASNLVPGDANGKQDIFVLTLKPWGDLGSALAGSGGTPHLAGNGTLAGGSSCNLKLSSAAPAAPALLFVSLTSAPVPFKGGTLVASPSIAQALLFTNGTGSLFLPFTWPFSAPSGTHLVFQFAIADPTAPNGVALSNGLDAVSL